MSRLFIVVEGRTEEQFCNLVLQPHLWAQRSIECIAMQVKRGGGGRGGGQSWQPWEKHLRNLLLAQSGREVRVSTLFDLYAAPRDTPGFSSGLSGPGLADQMLAAIAERIGDHRFVPYIQVYEFEALVFASLDALHRITPDAKARAALVADLDKVEQQPEALNDGYETAPSRRLKRHIPRYDKVLHGPDLAAATGLPLLRQRCPRFGAWVTTLEHSFGVQDAP